MAVTQYIGPRIAPVFADPVEWSSTKQYEPLTIVTYQGNSFTSRQFVPVGIGIDNADFWVETGNYNAQVEAYRQEVLQTEELIRDNQQAILSLTDELQTVSISKTTPDIYRYGRILIPQSNEPYSVQSCTYANGYYYVGLTNGDNTKQKIVVTDSQGHIIDEHHYTNLGHVNDICIDDNVMYVATGSRFVIVNITTWNVIEDTNFGVLSGITSVSEYEGDIYILAVKNGVRGLYAVANSVATRKYAIAALKYPQGMLINNGYVFISHTEKESIYMYSFKTGKLLRVFELPMSDGLYPVHECETVFIRDGQLCFTGSAWFSSSHVFESIISTDACYVGLFETNILDGTPLLNYRDDVRSYVSFTCDSNTTYTFNPDAQHITSLVEVFLLSYANPTRGEIRNCNGNLYLSGYDTTITIRGGRITNLEVNSTNATIVLTDNVIVERFYGIYSDIISIKNSASLISIIANDVKTLLIDGNTSELTSITLRNTDLTIRARRKPSISDELIITKTGLASIRYIGVTPRNLFVLLAQLIKTSNDLASVYINSGASAYIREVYYSNIQGTSDITFPNAIVPQNIMAIKRSDNLLYLNDSLVDQNYICNVDLVSVI